MLCQICQQRETTQPGTEVNESLPGEKIALQVCQQCQQALQRTAALTEAEYQQAVLEIMEKAGIDPRIRYAFRKTGNIVTVHNQHILSAKALQEWQAACDEYDRQAQTTTDQHLIRCLIAHYNWEHPGQEVSPGDVITEKKIPAFETWLDENGSQIAGDHTQATYCPACPECQKRQRPGRFVIKVSPSQEWVTVYNLEGGLTAVAARRGLIDVSTYEKTKQFISLTSDHPPGDTGYAPDGNTYGSREALGNNIIPIIDKFAVPRSDYDPQKHDTLHLSFGPIKLKRAVESSRSDLVRLGLLTDIHTPGSAFDAMVTLHKLFAKEYDILEKLERAHPVIWSEAMLWTADQAVRQLQQDITATKDLLYLNPLLWLYSALSYEECVAEKAIEPVTVDGHIPFSDEQVPDLGAAVIGRLYYLTETAIKSWHFYLLRDNNPRLEVRASTFPLGSQPLDRTAQFDLKVLRFAASPYLIIKHYPLERHFRRRAENYFKQVDRGVGVITLRRLERLSQSPKEAGEREVDWSCQWWVSGHWRNQYYPSMYSHQALRIAPYIKGPTNKPIKEPVRLMIR
jgi:hypothetical protein